MPDGGIISITEPIEIELVDDRIHFTCISGRRRTTYAISFHKARGAAHLAMGLLELKQRAQNIATLPTALRGTKRAHD